MFTEILKIVPRIDKAALAVMEHTLTKRFMRVAGRFGKGLEKVMKGNILLLSMGFITQLLNPLEKIHDKIKDMLGQGFDIDELAERFESTPGSVKRLQVAGQALGLDPQRLNDMMSKYAEVIQTAREELSNPTVQPSQATMAVSEFIGEGDLVKSFMSFLQSLKRQSESRDMVEIDVRTGNRITSQEDRVRLNRLDLARSVTGADMREQVENSVFGQKQTGAARRLIDADLAGIIQRLGISEPSGEGAPNEPGLDKALENIIARNRQQTVLETQGQLRDFIQSGNAITPAMINGMEAAAERQRQEDLRQLRNAEAFQEASKNVDEIKKLLTALSENVLKLLGYLGQFVPEALQFFNKVKDSRFLRSFFKG